MNETILGIFSRVLGDKANCFTYEIIEKSNDKNVFSISAENDKVLIEGDCVISVAMGLYSYLKRYLNINISWCGNREIEINEIVLPKEKTTCIIDQKYRSEFNYCTFGYSMVWWDFDRWEKELDFMAMNGINFPLMIIGSEAVWYYTLLEYGFSKNEALSFISSPVHWPWQMMTNIEGVMPAMNEEYILARLDLGKKVLARMLEMGMTPIQSGFGGCVPMLFLNKFKNAKLRSKPNWCGFKGTLELDPLDPLFNKFGMSFLKKQKELFGAYHYYAVDPFHESEPPIKSKEYLEKVSKSISGLLNDFDSEYIWVMQSWSIRKEIVKASPKDKLLILDLAGEKHEKTDYFWGYDFITGNLHNFGGRINMHGDIKLLCENKYEKLKEKGSVVGTGMFMEGIEQNPLYYDLAFEMLTKTGEQNLDEYLKNYALRRFGSADERLVKALNILKNTVYKEGTNGVELSSIIAARPAINIKKSGPNDGFSIPYDKKELRKALELLLSCKDLDLKDGYYFDVYDIARQVASNELQAIWKDLMKSYLKGEKSEYQKIKDGFLNLMTMVDQLLKSRIEFNFDNQINMAKKLARNKDEEKYFISCAKSLVTIWGPCEVPDIFDYSWREWGGLIGSFYIERYKMFLTFLEKQWETKGFFRYKTFSEKRCKKCHGRESFFGNSFYKDLAKWELAYAKNGKYECVSLENNNKKVIEHAQAILART